MTQDQFRKEIQLKLRDLVVLSLRGASERLVGREVYYTLWRELLTSAFLVLHAARGSVLCSAPEKADLFADIEKCWVEVERTVLADQQFDA